METVEIADLPVLVTGGAGFIGSHLAAELAERGARVRVLDDLSSGSRDNLAEIADVDFLEGDIRDPRVCDSACRGVRWVFHQAARGSVPRSIAAPGPTIAVNVLGTANLFAAARDAGAERVVYASSSSVYGDSERLPKREGEEGRPLSPYAASKWMNEELADVFARCYGLLLVGLRYFNVYGPRQSPEGPYAAVIPRFFGACLAGERPRIFGDGEQTRDFTWVGDAVRANLLAAMAPEAACGRSYNVAAGRRISVNRLAAAVAGAAGASVEPIHEPPRPGDVPHSHADLTRSREQLGYQPRTGLEEGLASSAAFYRGLFESRRRTAGSTAEKNK